MNAHISACIDRNAHNIIGAVILFVFFLAGCDLTHVHALWFHDSHFTGFIAGSPVRAIVVGHTIHGWVVSANAALD